MLFLRTLVLAACLVSRIRSERTVMAWATANPAAVAQLKNASWAGIFDGVQANCGISFAPDGQSLAVNRTEWSHCDDLFAAVKATKKLKFHVWIDGVPPAAIANHTAVLTSALRVAKELGIDGYSIDDEFDCAPRSTLRRFQEWVAFINAFSAGLHGEHVELSAAVQAMFGIQDVAYKPACSPQDNPACSQACNKAPYEYKFEPAVANLMASSTIDRWLEMDTYYFGTGRFLNALDWYAEHVPLGKLGVSMMNRADISADGYLARFHAIERSKANWLNIFLLPASDEWLPFLKRWKTQCAGCGTQSTLACYDLSVACSGDD